MLCLASYVKKTRLLYPKMLRTLLATAGVANGHCTVPCGHSGMECVFDRWVRPHLPLFIWDSDGCMQTRCDFMAWHINTCKRQMLTIISSFAVQPTLCVSNRVCPNDAIKPVYCTNLRLMFSCTFAGERIFDWASVGPHNKLRRQF